MTEASAPRSPAGALLVARDLACARGERVLFRGFGLTLAPRDLVWLRAANGIGKTSLLRLLSGLARPEDGVVERSGTPLYLAHANALKDDLHVREALAFLALHGLATDPARLDDALDRFGLRARGDMPVRLLSQGQRRRVALARLCLATDQDVWLLDEPFDALDAEATAVVSGLISVHASRGGAVLYTSHVPVAISHPAPREVALAPAARR